MAKSKICRSKGKEGIEEDLTALARLIGKDIVVYVFVSRTGRKKELLSFKWSKHFEHDLEMIEDDGSGYFG